MTGRSPVSPDPNVASRRSGPPWRRNGPPPWWPEGESWPSQRAPWRASRRFILTRIFVFVGIFLILIALLGWLASSAWHAGGNAEWTSGDHGGPPGPIILRPIIGIAVILTVIFFFVRRVRRTVEPLVDVMEAADRVAEGDYQVRVSQGGSREVGRLISSFNAMAERLDVNETQRQLLFADIAHELRTPLSVIQGNIEGMLDGIYPRDDDHLAPLLDETRVISRLLNDLQTIATAEAGMLQLHREPTAIDDLLRDVVAAFTPLAKSQGIGLAIGGGPVPLEANIDVVRLRQVLDNLVSNAIRYTPDGGQIRISVHHEGDAVAYTVADTGKGMDPEEAAHMFERFVKSKDSGGSGLGLAIAKGIVEAHGGTINATSALGEGTAVRFTLPIR